ncbi:hypothetical protein [Nannocystis pusilla]|uniref:hypothetical protein n=1 Tax=Nannocystis pusilla TaxID=889268 RepID=UPI003B78DCE2
MPNRYYVHRDAIRDRLQIELREFPVDDLEEDTGEGVPVAASIELQQPSRLARSPFVVTDLSFPPPTLDGSVDSDPVLFKAWPRYDVGDENADQPLYAKLTYQDDVAGDQPFLWGRGIVARQLMRKKTVEAGDDEFKIHTIRECHRRVLGNIRFPDGPLASEPPLETPATVAVNMRHAGRADDGDPETPVCDPNPIGQTPATCSVETIVNSSYPTCATSGQCPDPFQCYADPDGSGKRCGCKRDSECPQGQVCRVDLQQCALDLTDRPAIKQVTAEAKDDAAVSAWVYTYCDENPAADRTMEFVVSTTPDARLGLPRLNYRVVLTFLVGDIMGSTPLGRICLPTWQRAVEVLVPLKGTPARLFKNEAGQEWTCCDTSCLAEAATKPPAAPETCPIKAPITIVGDFAVPDPATWAAAACMPLSGADEQGTVRVNYGSADCNAAGEACSVNLSPGPAGATGRPTPCGSSRRSARCSAPPSSPRRSPPTPPSCRSRSSCPACCCAARPGKGLQGRCVHAGRGPRGARHPGRGPQHLARPVLLQRPHRRGSVRPPGQPRRLPRDRAADGHPAEQRHWPGPDHRRRSPRGQPVARRGGRTPGRRPGGRGPRPDLRLRVHPGARRLRQQQPGDPARPHERRGSPRSRRRAAGPQRPRNLSFRRGLPDPPDPSGLQPAAGAAESNRPFRRPSGGRRGRVATWHKRQLRCRREL